MPNYAFDVGELTLSGDGFLPTAAFTIPELASLRGAFLLGAGAEWGALNLINGGSPVSVVGTPAWNDGYAALSRGTGYIDTGIAETAAMTLMFIGRRAAAVNTPFMGNYANSANVGVCLYSLSGANMIGNADRGAAGGSATLASDLSAFAIYSLVVPATGAMTLRNHTAGTSVVGAATGARAVETANTLRIGAFHETTFSGVAHIAAALVFDAALSEADLARYVAWLREAGHFGGLEV